MPAKNLKNQKTQIKNNLEDSTNLAKKNNTEIKKQRSKKN